MNSVQEYNAQVANEPNDTSLKRATGTNDLELQSALVRQIYAAIPVPDHLHPLDKATLKDTAVAALRDIQPQDIIEGMLAVQYVATEYTVMDCFKRAAAAGRSLEVWERSLRQADRLMSTGLRLMEALDRRRGRGPANVTAGNVLNVQPGGQAVVSMQAQMRQAGADAGATHPAQGYDPGATGDPGQGPAPVVNNERIKRPAVAVPQEERIKRPPVPTDERIRRDV